MGFFDRLEKKYDDFMSDPASNISSAVSRGVTHLNDSYIEKVERAQKIGERKARSVSDEELRRYSDKVSREGNTMGMEIVRKEMERRNMR